MNKAIERKVKVWGDSGKEYQITEYSDGSFSCNCPAWIFHRGQRVDCKHIRDLKDQRIKHEIILQGLDKEKEK